MNQAFKLTTKSQVTVPKDVRDKLGVGPGGRLRFDIGQDGRVTLLAADDPGECNRREADFGRRIAEAQKRFKAQDQMPGISVDEYYAMMRGPPAEA